MGTDRPSSGGGVDLHHCDLGLVGLRNLRQVVTFGLPERVVKLVDTGD